TAAGPSGWRGILGTGRRRHPLLGRQQPRRHQVPVHRHHAVRSGQADARTRQRRRVEASRASPCARRAQHDAPSRPPRSPKMISPIVLIHGLWLTPRSWEGWKARFEQRGYEVLAPAWPCMDREVEALRRDPSVMNGLGVTEVVDHYDSIVRGLDTPPVI